VQVIIRVRNCRMFKVGTWFQRSKSQVILKRWQLYLATLLWISLMYWC